MEAHDFGFTYAAESAAAKEIEEFGVGTARTPYTYGLIALGSALEHADAFRIALETNVMTIAPLTLARATIEAGSLARWIFDSRLTSQQRQARGLLCRLEDNTLITKLGGAVQNDDELLAMARNRRTAIVSAATELGLEIRLGQKGDLVGVGSENAPNITQRVAEQFDQETTYRLLSGVAHSRLWALTQTSFVQGPRLDGEIQALKKQINRLVLLRVLFDVADCLSVPAWEVGLLQGWDMTGLAATFTEFHLASKTRPETWFWRRR
ncbi:MAG: hypothetical protein IT300_02980 [Dehalococcoidia bacterium]|nr:hypothetical protein [Dehalococcoidia bacterium]